MKNLPRCQVSSAPRAGFSYAWQTSRTSHPAWGRHVRPTPLYFSHVAAAGRADVAQSHPTFKAALPHKRTTRTRHYKFLKTVPFPRTLYALCGLCACAKSALKMLSTRKCKLRYLRKSAIGAS